MKTPVLESLFSKVADLQACQFIIKRLQHRCFPESFGSFLKNIYFEEDLQTAASNYSYFGVFSVSTFLKFILVKVFT